MNDWKYYWLIERSEIPVRVYDPAADRIGTNSFFNDWLIVESNVPECVSLKLFALTLLLTVLSISNDSIVNN